METKGGVGSGIRGHRTIRMMVNGIPTIQRFKVLETLKQERAKREAEKNKPTEKPVDPKAELEKLKVERDKLQSELDKRNAVEKPKPTEKPKEEKPKESEIDDKLRALKIDPSKLSDAEKEAFRSMMELSSTPNTRKRQFEQLRSTKVSKQVEKIQKEMADKFNIGEVKILVGQDSSNDKANPMSISKTIDEHFSYIKEQYPQVFKQSLQSFTVNESVGKGTYDGTQVGFLGINVYSKKDNTNHIEVAVRDTWVSESKDIMYGQTNSDKDIAKIAVHEVGHHYYHTGLNDKQKSEFEAIDKKLSASKKAGVSLYAATNHMELFAESFLAYATKDYKRGSLPKTVEKFFDANLAQSTKKSLSQPISDEILGDIIRNVLTKMMGKENL